MSVTAVRTSKRIFLMIGVFLIGCLVGNEWRIFRDYETFIYPVSLYSRRLHQLAASQDLAGLTNAVIEFDEKFPALSAAVSVWARVLPEAVRIHRF